MTTRLEQRIAAPVSAVYQALLDADAVRQWMVPDGMTSEIQSFEGCEGGSFRISLTYDEGTSIGKTSSHTDTFGGRFTRLVPNREVVQEVEFETTDPAMQGVMKISYQLREEDGATVVTGLHEDMPLGLSQEQNDLGWRISMAKFARLVESGHDG